MGVPTGHPFFGNQHTTGGYTPGTYTYRLVEKGIENPPTVTKEIQKGAIAFLSATKEKFINLIPKNLVSKDLSKYVVVISGIILALDVVREFKNNKIISNTVKAKQDSPMSIELQNVGTCKNCGEPLFGSKYVPEAEGEFHIAYIVCKKCGEKNFGRYTDESDSASKGVDHQANQ